MAQLEAVDKSVTINISLLGQNVGSKSKSIEVKAMSHMMSDH